jgi:hypothetical protein
MTDIFIRPTGKLSSLQNNYSPDPKLQADRDIACETDIIGNNQSHKLQADDR